MSIKNFTNTYGEWICRDSVTLSTINGIIYLSPCIWLGQKFFASIWAKKYVPNFFSVGWAGAEGQKNTHLSSYLSHLTRYWFEDWNLSQKLKNKIKNICKNIGWWPWADWPKSNMAIFDRSKFLHKRDPKLFCILMPKWSKKLDRPIFGWSAGMHLTKTAWNKHW